MSQHIFNTPDGREVRMGYDRPLDYVFCTVFDSEGEIVYSNLGDENAGCGQQDVNYYRPILKGLGIEAPEAMFTETAADQAARTGNRVLLHEGSGS